MQGGKEHYEAPVLRAYGSIAGLTAIDKDVVEPADGLYPGSITLGDVDDRFS